MKKYFFFAAAALVALAACSKVELDPSATPDVRIGFQVAKYMPQTKGTFGEGTSIWGEWTNPTFYTFAFYYPAVGNGNQTYMNNVQINPYKSDGTTAADTEANTAIWKSAVDYFWPKTGYINFFSYASKRDIHNSVSFADVANAETKTVSFGTADSPLTIASDDNILLADACYNATEANSAPTFVNNITGTDETTPGGVPTLFHHLLSQVKFQAKLRSEKAHANTSYEVDIISANITTAAETDPTSGLYNNGFLTATSEAKTGTALDTKDWNLSGTQAWSAATTASYEPVVVMTPTSSALVLPVQATPAEHFSTGDFHVLLAARTFRPQAIASDVKFTITYKVRALHDSVKYSEETITATVDLDELTPNSGVWRCNDSVTYNVYIDPVTTAITFDPAVAAWTGATGTVNIPATS